MEPTPENLQSLAALLEQAGMANREAEAQLTAHQTTAGYSTLLLRIVGEQSVAMSVRLMAAVVLKNYVKKFWSDAFEPVCDADKHTVKQQIVDLMLLAPPQIQKVLSTAVGTICQADFPTSWQDLLPNLVQKLASNDVHVMTGVLGTLHDIFKRYRHEFKSEDLWQEIKYVLDVFAEPFTALFQSLMGMIPLYENDKANLEIVTRMLLLVAKIFNSLNAQDLPEHFEDNMGIWLPGFLQLLRYDNVLLHTDDDVSADDAGALVSLKSQICSNIALYASMYDEESVEHLPAFVEAVWELLVNTPTTEKYDLLISHGIGFLTSVSERPTYRHLFEGGLTAICEKVIVPNMMLGESDQEMFEDDPEEWIRRDMEGSDVDTRRRAACDLVRALCRFFQKEVSDIFTNYISAMVGAYAADPAANYISKEAALYLITSLTVRATVRTAGATQINPLVDIVDFFTSHVLPELSAVNAQTNAVDPDAGFAILKGSCIKFIHTFRAQLPTEATRSALTPLLVSHLYASNTVVHTYAAVALEELCALPEPPENPTTTKLRAEEITPQLESILNAVFKVLFSQSTQANEFSGENEYLMKLVMRVIALSKTAISPYSDTEAIDRFRNDLNTTLGYEVSCVSWGWTCHTVCGLLLQYSTGLTEATLLCELKRAWQQVVERASSRGGLLVAAPSSILFAKRGSASTSQVRSVDTAVRAGKGKLSSKINCSNVLDVVVSKVERLAASSSSSSSSEHTTDLLRLTVTDADGGRHAMQMYLPPRFVRNSLASDTLSQWITCAEKDSKFFKEAPVHLRLAGCRLVRGQHGVTGLPSEWVCFMLSENHHKEILQETTARDCPVSDLAASCDTTATVAHDRRVRVRVCSVPEYNSPMGSSGGDSEALEMSVVACDVTDGSLGGGAGQGDCTFQLPLALTRLFVAGDLLVIDRPSSRWSADQQFELHYDTRTTTLFVHSASAAPLLIRSTATQPQQHAPSARLQRDYSSCMSILDDDNDGDSAEKEQGEEDSVATSVSVSERERLPDGIFDSTGQGHSLDCGMCVRRLRVAEIRPGMRHVTLLVRVVRVIGHNVSEADEHDPHPVVLEVADEEEKESSTSRPLTVVVHGRLAREKGARLHVGQLVLLSDLLVCATDTTAGRKAHLRPSHMSAVFTLSRLTGLLLTPPLRVSLVTTLAQVHARGGGVVKAVVVECEVQRDEETGVPRQRATVSVHRVCEREVLAKNGRLHCDHCQEYVDTHERTRRYQVSVRVRLDDGTVHQADALLEGACAERVLGVQAVHLRGIEAPVDTLRSALSSEWSFLLVPISPSLLRVDAVETTAIDAAPPTKKTKVDPTL